MRLQGVDIYFLLYFRSSIEGSYSQEVDQMRKRYTKEDKQCIKRFTEARNFSLKSERSPQKNLSTDSELFKKDIRGEHNI